MARAMVQAEVTFRLPPETLDWLKALAGDDGPALPRPDGERWRRDIGRVTLPQGGA